jgi:PST family polysaccharide transporter
LQTLFNIVTGVSFIAAILLTIISEWLVIKLFGVTYQQSASIVTIHVWCGIFVSLGLASSNWYLAENFQHFMFYRTILGAIINIIANLFLIPRYEILGAAIATLISQAFATYLFDFVNPPTRKIFYMQSKSLFLNFLCR